MNIQKLAEFLLERRRRASPIVLTGEVINAVESEGLQEALQRRWLVADPDTGNLQITTNFAHIGEMESVAATPPSEEQVVESEATDLAMRHAQRRIDEIAAPATGKPAPTMGNPAPAPAPSAPPPADPTKPSGFGVGDDVMIAQEGKTYTGKVASVTPQGRYRLSFGPDRPGMDRDYEANEVRHVGDATV